jgi:membrane associated rhomboid family serine protease
MIRLSLVDKLLKLFGSSERQMRWKLHRWRNAREAQRSSRANIGRHLKYQHKICDSCGQVIDRNERLCPHCDEKVASWGVKLSGKLLERWLPQTGALTGALLVINGLIFIYTTFMTDKLWGISGYSAIHFGANYGPLMTAGGEWWRLLSYNFIHVGGLIHVGFNLFALAYIGPIVEEWYGSSRAAILFVMTGIVGGLASHMFSPLAPSGGASGAVLGMIGAGVAAGHLSGNRAGMEMRNSLLKWVVYCVIFGLVVAGIDNAAHMGGLGAGVVLGVGMRKPRNESLREKWAFRGMAFVAVGLCALSLVLASVSFAGYPATQTPSQRTAVIRRCIEPGAVPVEETLQHCLEAAHLDSYSNPGIAYVTAQYLEMLGEDAEADRVLAIFAATWGYDVDVLVRDLAGSDLIN